MGIEILEIEGLKGWIDQSDSVVVFTGAGVSTDSGIPDFRGKGGIYERYDPSTVFDLAYFNRDPSYFYTFARQELFNLSDKEPNITHRWIASLESQGKVKGVITQNIDILHQRAGSKRVYELHGSVEKSHCMRCRKAFAWKVMVDKILRQPVPRCDDCEGVIKPDVVFFGEQLPQRVFEDAWRLCEKADLMLVMGSSLQVYPAAHIPLWAKEKGASLVIINREATPFDSIADMVIHAPLSEISRAMLGERP